MVQYVVDFLCELEEITNTCRQKRCCELDLNIILLKLKYSRLEKQKELERAAEEAAAEEMDTQDSGK